GHALERAPKDDRPGGELGSQRDASVPRSGRASAGEFEIAPRTGGRASCVKTGATQLEKQFAMLNAHIPVLDSSTPGSPELVVVGDLPAVQLGEERVAIA